MKILKYIRACLVFSFMSFFVACSENQQPTKSPNNIKSVVSSKPQEIDKNIQKNNIPSSFLSNNKINTTEMKIINKDGILFIIDGKKEYILTSRGLDYKVHISTDKKLLVVDILKINNLQIVELFSKKGTNRLKRVKRRLNKEIWNEYLKDKSYEFKDIEDAELKFYEWVDNDSFEIILSYEFEDKLIEKIVRYDVSF